MDEPVPRPRIVIPRAGSLKDSFRSFVNMLCLVFVSVYLTYLYCSAEYYKGLIIRFMEHNFGIYFSPTVTVNKAPVVEQVRKVTDEAVQKVTWFLDRDLTWWLSFLEVVTVQRLINGTLVTIFVSACLLMTHALLKKILPSFWVQRTVQWYRGVQWEFSPEAMQVGSSLMEGRVPSFQLQIKRLSGLFKEDHVGFAVRVSEHYMVAPKHVLKFVPQQLKLVGPTGALVINTPPIVESRVYPDLAYVRLGSQLFSRMGVTMALLAHSTERPVDISGCIDGKVYTSSGILKINGDLQYMMEYSGSTVPGFSGAAYYDNHRVYGIHTAAYKTMTMDADKNVGFSAQVISNELKRIIASFQESPMFYANDTNTKQYDMPWAGQFQIKDFDFPALDETLDDAWGGEPELDYEEQLDFETPLKKMASLEEPQRKAMESLIQCTPEQIKEVLAFMTSTKKMKAKGQSDEQASAEVNRMVYDASHTQFTVVMQKCSALEERVDKLEARVCDDFISVRSSISTLEKNQEQAIIKQLEEKKPEPVQQVEQQSGGLPVVSVEEVRPSTSGSQEPVQKKVTIVEPAQQTGKMTTEYRCNLCKKQFKEILHMQVHYAMKHMVEESALAEDFKKTIHTVKVPFLESTKMRKPSHQRSGRNLNRDSTMFVRSSPYTDRHQDNHWNTRISRPYSNNYVQSQQAMRGRPRIQGRN